MSVKQVVALQYQQIVERASRALAQSALPPEGWLRTVRNALQMSGSQLARRLGVTRAQVYQSEKAELTGRITIKKMHEMADALDCRFVYGLVPKSSIEESIASQALKKAKAYVSKTNEHMSLEGQSLHPKQIDFEIKRLADELAQSPARDLWDEDD